eukprot:5289299-Pleurochrysis_carterae.AAC.2
MKCEKTAWRCGRAVDCMRKRGAHAHQGAHAQCREQPQFSFDTHVGVIQVRKKHGERSSHDGNAITTVKEGIRKHCHIPKRENDLRASTNKKNEQIEAINGACRAIVQPDEKWARQMRVDVDGCSLLLIKCV